MSEIPKLEVYCAECGTNSTQCAKEHCCSECEHLWMDAKMVLARDKVLRNLIRYEHNPENHFLSSRYKCRLCRVMDVLEGKE